MTRDEFIDNIKSALEGEKGWFGRSRRRVEIDILTHHIRIFRVDNGNREAVGLLDKYTGDFYSTLNNRKRGEVLFNINNIDKSGIVRIITGKEDS